MEKGKFGFSVAVYPLLILACVLFSQIWIALAILVAALVLEQSNKAHKLSIQAALMAFVYPVYSFFTGQLSHFFFRYLPWQIAQFSDRKALSSETYDFFTNTERIFAGIGTLIFVAFVCYVLFAGVLPLLKGNEMKMPFKKAVNRFYGIIEQRAQVQYVQQQPQPQQQYAQPQQQPQQYVQQPQPQQQYPQQPPPPQQ